MSFTAPTSRDDLLVRIAGTYTQVSALVCDPPDRRGTVFAIHDFAGNAHDFEPLAAFFAERRLRLVCPDMLGRGKTAWLAGGRYTLRDVLHELMVVIETYKDADMALLGTGWGSLIAMLTVHLASFRPTRVVLAEALLDWAPSRDPDCVMAAKLTGAVFPTRQAGVAALLEAGVFAGAAPEWATRLAGNRLTTVSGGFSVALDPALKLPKPQQSYDIPRMVAALPVPATLLWGGHLAPQESVRMLDITTASLGRLRSSQGLNGGARLRFTRSAELVGLAAAFAP
jgi:pimeloyl-ACP methyl ester carboxylesterase